ncbi:2-hydroxyacid dehydrogenase [Pandoraea terrae]|uniref:2-hydroxyacid dehydrogenase n=1 Tax=Pandoraea terrae TaxID=1537710 RepID=UPI001CD47F3B|nr:2-hydroxyacid dehydrogenase [Pandoraea terrae]
MLPSLLVLIPLKPEYLERLGAHFHVIHDPGFDPSDTGWGDADAHIRFVLTNGARGLHKQEFARLPKLELAAALGVGHESIDRKAAAAHGVKLVNGAGSNADCVADHGFALLLGAVRFVPSFDAACRKGVWRDALPTPPNFSGKRMGIVGLGAIGSRFAVRAEGFGIDIGYRNRKARDDVPEHYRYFNSVRELAEWADYLVVTAPGGPDSHHLINAEILDALGPSGYLVNVGRGSSVDTAALAEALRDRRIAGAALDVYEGEPAPPAELIGLENVVLSPHVGARSPEAEDAAITLFIENANRHLAGQPLLTPL